MITERRKLRLSSSPSALTWLPTRGMHNSCVKVWSVPVGACLCVCMSDRERERELVNESESACIQITCVSVDASNRIEVSVVLCT